MVVVMVEVMVVVTTVVMVEHFEIHLCQLRWFVVSVVTVFKPMSTGVQW